MAVRGRQGGDVKVFISWRERSWPDGLRLPEWGKARRQVTKARQKEAFRTKLSNNCQYTNALLQHYHGFGGCRLPGRATSTEDN